MYFYRAVCRDKTKQGVCPKVPRDNKYASCTQDCTSDSDCDGDQKCCFNGSNFHNALNFWKTFYFKLFKLTKFM